jgi:hypothetical protein
MSHLRNRLNKVFHLIRNIFNLDLLFIAFLLILFFLLGCSLGFSENIFISKDYKIADTVQELSHNSGGNILSSPVSGEAFYRQVSGGISGTRTAVHDPGTQRSDRKSGNASDYHFGNVVQEDAIRMYNYVRQIRDIN